VRIPYTFAKSEHLKKTSIRKKTGAQAVKMLQDMKVLLVEDNDINRLYAKSILQQWNCSVDIAENGLVAIEKIKYNFYDVVLMDVQMPVMDGYEATRAIRLMDSHMRHAPIVALTANATKSDIDKCLSSGMNDYLPKPFTPDDLYRKIFRDLKIKKQKNGSSGKTTTNRKTNFDLAYLRNISDNNQDFLQEMIQTFVESIPPVLKEMQEALADQSWKKLSRLAHQIKPSFTLLGMEVLRKTVFFIEENADQKTNLVELVSMTQLFIEDCKKVIADLKKEIISA
jgi:CheY-like chemotaxis protein